MKATFWKAGFNTVNVFQGLRLFREIIQTKPEDLEKASNEHKHYRREAILKHLRQPDGSRDSLRFSESFQSNSTPAFNHYFPYVENNNNSNSEKEDLVFKSPAKGTLLEELNWLSG